MTDVGVQFDLHAAIGKMHDGYMDRLERLINAQQEKYVILAASAATSTTARTTIVVGTIPLGRVYDLRLLAIAPNPITTAVTVDVYIMVGSPTAGLTSGAQYRDKVTGGSIPVTWGPEGRGAFPIRGGDTLYLVLGTSGAVADVNVTAVLGDNEDRP